MSHAPLLQSRGYGEVQAAEGWRPIQVEIPSGRALVLLAGRGPALWAYVPRGPVPSSAQSIEELVVWARERGLARLRVEPEAGQALGPLLREQGFRFAPHLHPPQTMLVALQPDEEAMLASFKPKHRYNIRLAERKGVTVQCGTDAGEMVRLGEATARRQGIVAYSPETYRRRLERLEWCRVYVARHEGEALAAIMVARFDGRAYYLFGGSSPERQNLMPTYAVQWAAMREAGQAGCTEYDLWGVPPDADPGHPWHGLWQFKAGFNGEMVAYAGAWELDLNPAAARLLRAGEWLRRRARRLRGNIS